MNQDYDKKNLLRETIDVLAENGKTPADVQWCGSPQFGSFTWDEFAALADVEYDSGFGGAEVATDLMVVGDGWWLQRGEYDGSEWWDFLAPVVRPERRVPRRLVGGLWPNLTDMDAGDDD